MSLLGIGILVWVGYEMLFGGGKDKGANGDGGGSGILGG